MHAAAEADSRAAAGPRCCRARICRRDAPQLDEAERDETTLAGSCNNCSEGNEQCSATAVEVSHWRRGHWLLFDTKNQLDIHFATIAMLTATMCPFKGFNCSVLHQAPRRKSGRKAQLRPRPSCNAPRTKSDSPTHCCVLSESQFADVREQQHFTRSSTNSAAERLNLIPRHNGNPTHSKHPSVLGHWQLLQHSKHPSATCRT